jgi:hypothetical protein
MTPNQELPAMLFQVCAARPEVFAMVSYPLQLIVARRRGRGIGRGRCPAPRSRRHAHPRDRSDERRDARRWARRPRRGRRSRSLVASEPRRVQLRETGHRREPRVVVRREIDDGAAGAQTRGRTRPRTLLDPAGTRAGTQKGRPGAPAHTFSVPTARALTPSDERLKLKFTLLGQEAYWFSAVLEFDFGLDLRNCFCHSAASLSAILAIRCTKAVSTSSSDLSVS